jgi:hypothetical protein
MDRGFRRGFTAAEKTELWDRSFRFLLGNRELPGNHDARQRCPSGRPPQEARQTEAALLRRLQTGRREPRVHLLGQQCFLQDGFANRTRWKQLGLLPQSFRFLRQEHCGTLAIRPDCGHPTPTSRRTAASGPGRAAMQETGLVSITAHCAKPFLRPYEMVLKQTRPILASIDGLRGGL